MIIPNRFTSRKVEMPKWAEICLPEWKTMAQYLEYKLKELEEEKPEWQALEFKAELYKGWQEEMTEDDSDDEEGDDEEDEDEGTEDGATDEAVAEVDRDVKEDSSEAADVAPTDAPTSIEENPSSGKNNGETSDDQHADNMNNHSDNERDDDASSTSSSSTKRGPRVPVYSARVVAYHARGCTFEANVNHLFDFITYLAQNHYDGLPYENWGPDHLGVQEIEIPFPKEAIVLRTSM